MGNQIGSLKMGQKFKKTPAGEIPVDWGVATISDLCQVNPEVIKESTPPDTQLKYIDIASVERTGSISAPKDMEFKDAPSRARRIVKAGDIIVSTVRPYLRAFARITDLSENLIASTGFAVLRSRPNVNGGYVYQHVLSDTFVKYLEGKMTGSSYPAVNSSDVAEYQMPVPSIVEQEKISVILSGVDTLINKSSAEIKKSQELKRGLMRQLLARGIGHKRITQTEIGDYPENWEIVSVDSIGELGRGRVINKEEINSHPGKYPVYSSQSKNDGAFGYLDTNDFEGEYVTWTTDGAHAGTVFFRNGKFNCTNVCGTIKPRNAEVIDARFLAYILSTRTKRHVSYVGNPKLMNNIMGSILFPCPPVIEQRKIATVLQGVEEDIDAAEKRLNKIIELKQSLLAALLVGRVRVR